jgi:hypothetical protein
VNYTPFQPPALSPLYLFFLFTTMYPDFCSCLLSGLSLISVLSLSAQLLYLLLISPFIFILFPFSLFETPNSDTSRNNFPLNLLKQSLAFNGRLSYAASLFLFLYNTFPIKALRAHTRIMHYKKYSNKFKNTHTHTNNKSNIS